MLWRAIAGFENYEISEIGQIRNIKTGRIRKLQTHNGYYFVMLGRAGKYWNVYSHREVAKAFLPPPPTPENTMAAHKNGISRCNHYSNLYWATPQQNMDDRKRHGTDNVGSRHGRSKLTEDDVVLILKDSGKQTEIAKKHGVSFQTISLIKKGRTWRHVPR